MVVAPDKFKGSLTAAEAASAIARGVRAVNAAFDVRLVPMADGGEGTIDAFLASPGWERVTHTVRGPLGDPVGASFAFDGLRAVVEMAAASGLALVPPHNVDPLRASTYGTGELVRAALAAGARHVVVAVGGSATNDGGAGLLAALGVRLLDSDGRELPPGGASLARLATIDLAGLDPRLHGATVEVAADVDHPLVGPRGASAVFGPQKGASAQDVLVLDAALVHYADVAARTLGVDRRSEPGAGAAGGLAFGLAAFANARIASGVSLVAELRDLRGALRGATRCFTGEGRIDEQTLGGKTVAGVAAISRDAGVPVVAFGGSVTAHAEAALAGRGVVAMPIADGPLDLTRALAEAAALLERAAARAMRLAARLPAEL